MVKELAHCIRLNLDCADVCAATGSLGSRRAGSNEFVLRLTLEARAQACRLCGEECARCADGDESSVVIGREALRVRARPGSRVGHQARIVG